MPILSSQTQYEPLSFQDWGLIDYETANQKQLGLVQSVAETNHPGYLIICTHPPIVTLGRATQSDDVFAWTGPKIEVSRGGRATYHGPSQIVVYPIVNLKMERKGRTARDVVRYLRDFENSIVRTLSDFGINSVGRSLQRKANVEADETGVWVGNKKIASLGIAVKKWVTYHGAAINFSKDPEAFQGINPCGFLSNVVTTVEEVSHEKIDRSVFQDALKKNLILDL